MHRLILLLFFATVVCALHSQPVEYPVVSENGTTIKDFIPSGWHLFDTVSGDLNEDKLSDVAFVIEADVNATEGVEDEAGYEESMGSPRVLVIVFKRKKGGYRRSVQANTLVLRSHEGGVFGDPWAGMTADRGSLVVHFYGGSAWRWGLDYRFRYQDKGWYLIGATSIGYHSAGGEMESHDFNLLTGDVEITRGNMFGEECRPCDDCGACKQCERCAECERCVEVEDEITREKIGRKPLRKLESFTPMNWEIMPELFI